MKRMLLLLILCLGILLTGCASDTSKTASSAPPVESQAPEIEESLPTPSEPVEVGDDEEVIQTAFDLPLTYAKSYSDGLAWVQYLEEDERKVTAVIDVSGDIRFTLPEGMNPDYMGQFKNGYAYYRTSDDYEVIIDDEGNEHYSTKGLADDRNWSHIIGQANGLFLCYSMSSGMEHLEYAVSLVRADGTLVNSYSFGDFNAQLPYDKVGYFGDGWYKCSDSRYVNFERQISERITNINGGVGDGTVLHGTFEDGNIVGVSSSWNWPVIVDTNLDTTQFVESPFFEELSKCQIIGNYVLCADDNWGTMSSFHSFASVTYCDLYGNEICQITDYPTLKKAYTAFYGDYAVLFIMGADSHMYMTVIDRNGQIQFEPYDITDAEVMGERVYYNHLILRNAVGDYVLMDMDGNIVHSISADFPGCEIQRFNMMNEGFVAVTYQIDGEVYAKYYPIEEAVSLGEDVYNVGLLKLETEEEEESENTETEDDASDDPYEYTYVYLRDFSIEGKWKSVGDSGFGQAQPGAIVAFDGTNCNFFSPKDTYAFYQDGDTYKLDVTSYLFADTLTFTVNTIDEDHIVITSGQTVTELERIE